MSDVFCPEGFIPVETAILKVANRWFPESLETAVPQLATSDGNIEVAVQALRQLKRAEWPWDAIGQTITCLRNYLRQAKIKAYYFSKDGRQTVGQNFWATSEAGGVLAFGVYWPNGDPSTIGHRDPSIIDEQRPTTLFLMQSEVDALLIKHRKALPRSKIPELVEALHELSDLSRPKQLEALRHLFPQHPITHRIFWEIAKQVPTHRGNPTKQSGEGS